MVISQCVSGGISIGKYNNSNIFKKIGAISGHDITAESALAKAMHLIDNPNYSGDFAENFKKNLRGKFRKLKNKFYLCQQIKRKVSEWLKELPWKGSIRVTVSRVRIPFFSAKIRKLLRIFY